jgi:aminoglycoside phosphotransferase (APT) family kinase protein
VGFAYSPRVLGFDDKGREVLSYIEGESGREGWFKIHSDTGLQNLAKLLRDYHDAIAEYKPDTDSKWAYASGGLKPGEIVCHGDFGPWNVVWQGDKPVGIVDWDLLFPAPPRYDVLYALEYSAPFRDDETTLEWHHFSEVPDRKRRIEVFAQAYGLPKISNVVDGVATVQRAGAIHEKYLADHGLQQQIDWAANGDLETIEKRAQWTESHRTLFE